MAVAYFSVKLKCIYGNDKIFDSFLVLLVASVFTNFVLSQSKAKEH